MRSSKKRSRSGSNRSRTYGNIVNRVFDSSGPEGKVRGTPQQIIDKYRTLARDAQLSNDRVSAENFLQHAEHYARLLSEAQREAAAEQEARQQQQARQHANQNNGQNSGNRERRGDRAEADRGGGDRARQEQAGNRGERRDDPEGAEVIDLGRDEGTLVDLPESHKKDKGPDQPDSRATEKEEAAPEAAAAPRRRTRSRAAAKEAGDAEAADAEAKPVRKRAPRTTRAKPAARKAKDGDEADAADATADQD